MASLCLLCVYWPLFGVRTIKAESETSWDFKKKEKKRKSKVVNAAQRDDSFKTLWQPEGEG